LKRETNWQLRAWLKPVAPRQLPDANNGPEDIAAARTLSELNSRSLGVRPLHLKESADGVLAGEDIATGDLP